MLSPDEIDILTDKARVTTETLNMKIIQKIIQRLVARFDRGEDFTLTPIDISQADVLMDAGYLLKDIAEEVAKAKVVGARDIYDAFQEGFKESWKADSEVFRKHGITDNKPSQRYIDILQRNYEKTAGEFLNMTGTTARDATKVFIKAASDAYFATMTGGVSNAEALYDAVNEVAGSNIKTVEYDSGHTDTLEVAMLRAIRTGVAQTAGDIAIKRMEENGEDIILVSAHFGARPSHAEWQGKFYSLHGKTPSLPLFIPSTGYGTVTGLCGANCRHHFGPGDLDFNPYANLNIDREASDKAYELSQKQRARERDIRHAKQECMEWKTAVDAAKSPEVKAEMEKGYARAAEKLQRRNKSYNQFIKDNELKPYCDRLYVAGWNRSQAASATAAIKSAGKYGGIPSNWTKLNGNKPNEANPNYDRLSNNGPYNVNCYNCVVAFEMRIRGYNVIAAPRGTSKRLSLYPWEAWENREPIMAEGTGLDAIKEYLRITPEARINIAVTYKEKKSIWNNSSSFGHVFTAYVENGRLVLFDPESGRELSEKLFKNVTEGETCYWRVDDAIISDRGITACRKGD